LALVLPIFPLPDLTFFPHTLLPLHVFEGRYRALVEDCLGRGRPLAVVSLRPGWEDDYEGRPAVHAVGGAGSIVRWERLATGRFNIVVRGRWRVRIERELPADTLYRVAGARVIADRGAEGAGVEHLAAAVLDRARRVLRAVNRASAPVERALAEAREPGVLADRVASALIPDPALRQALLEEPHVERRLRRLVAGLDALLADLSGER
jgi:hypothetical protein